MRVAVLIPVLNEAPALPSVLAAVPRRHRIIVCDNGSIDASIEIAKEAGVEVVVAPRRGYGSAVQAGIAALAADPPDVVVIWDGDASVDPDDLPILLEPIAQGWADMVLGDRNDLADPGALTSTQIYGNQLATFLIQRRVGHRYADMGPFRAIRYPALLAMKLVDPTWGWNVEMQLKALKVGLRVVELPVHCRVRVGQSKISGTVQGVLRAGYRILWACWSYG